jgi:hypothetical protein
VTAPRIHLRLGALALHGVPRAQAGAMVAALRAELQRRLADPAVAAALLATPSSRRSRVDAGRFTSALAGARVVSAAAAAVDGKRVATAIHQGLIPTRVAPGGGGADR